MKIKQNPLFRKVITPWWDVDLVCYILIAFMAVIGFGSIVGIFVALETPEYHAHVWVPFLLFLMSAFVLVSVGFRLIKRKFFRGESG